MSSPFDYRTLAPNKGGAAVSWPGFGTYNYVPPKDVRQEIVRLQAEDNGWSQGILYSKGGEQTVVCLMHPRGDLSSHYCMPGLTTAGYAVFGQRSRWPNHDTACIHEIVLADVAAAVVHLRARGFRNVVLVGNSGGGSLFSFYQAQASIEPPRRLSHTAAGDPYDLNKVNMPRADALVMLAAHPGEGKYLMSVIDPSVTNESDPLSCNSSIDMYNPANGFRLPPEESRYSVDFVARYRVAQRERVARLDAIARQKIDEMRYHEKRLKELPTSAGEWITVQRHAVSSRYLTIYRTDANPAFTDLSIEPSARKVGSLLGTEPQRTNYLLGGFGSVMTPEAWLSTWSGLSSHGSVLDNLKKISAPFVLVHFTRDCCVFASEIEAMMKASASTDKSLVLIDADHYGIGPDGSMAPREQATTEIVQWLKSRFPA